jgi:DNA processing protein
MKNNLILTLLQIPKVSRKTVAYIFLRTNYRPSTKGEVIDMFRYFKTKNKRIIIPTENAIDFALKKTEEILQKSYENDIKIIDVLDERFPQKLKTIPDPPVILHYKGDFQCVKNEKSVAVIGTRNPSEHGFKIAERIGFVLGEAGFTVVSGLATGCDEFGHKGCLKAKGKTVAVMAGGLDKIYPAKNKDLAYQILDSNGCLVSEYPIGTRPFKSSFVERDRLQSGLSTGVFVVETDVKGGTMHTVGYSIEQGRILACYAHPQKCVNNKQSQGNIKLIDEGKAMPIKDENDINDFKTMIIEKGIDKISNNKDINDGVQLKIKGI